MSVVVVQGVEQLFARLYNDDAFRVLLLRAGDDDARRSLIAAAGFGGYSLDDVQSEVARIVERGKPVGVGGDPASEPSGEALWADAPFALKRARRSAAVFGALAATGAYDGADGWWALPKVKVDYLIAGSVKGGTTALDHFLSLHPGICTAVPKETHFFCRHIFFETDPPKYHWYSFAFRHYRGEKVVGEATPEYMYDLTAVQRIRAYNPGMKLIFVLRDPARRAYSQYRMAVERGQETRSFAQAVDADARAADGTEGTYTAGGFYLSAIEGLLRFFPKEQMLFLRNEDPLRHHRDTLVTVHRFLGVEPEPIPEPRELLVGSGPPMAETDRKLVLGLYEAEVRALERFLDWDLADWQT